MRKIILTILALASQACSSIEYPPEKQAIIEAIETEIIEWEAQGNNSGECKEVIHMVDVVVADSNSISDSCGVQHRLHGCLNGNTIYITDESAEKGYEFVFIHELRHWLGACSSGKIDGNHSIEEYWYPHKGEDILNDRWYTK